MEKTQLLHAPSYAVQAQTDDALDALMDFITHYKRLFILTGAGCSTASGIPDYRDTKGEWKRRQPVQYQDFLRSEKARQRYWARSLVGWPQMAQARPNGAHYGLARMQQAGLVHQLITQNVDGLHQKAGSRQVIDLHGRLDTVECLNCRSRFSREKFQRALMAANPDFYHKPVPRAPDGDAELENIDFQRFRIPPCLKCGGLVKPSVVFFGESVPRDRVELAYRRMGEADALLIVGSSLMVFSGYRFCRSAVEQNKPIAAVNLGRTRADGELTLKVVGSCGELLSALVARLGI